MTRQEFTKATKRQALSRSGKLCEAIGIQYGLAPDTRCNAPLSHGLEFDHILAASNGGDNSLENCCAVCIRCHKFKTEKHDTPRAAKTKRMGDKYIGVHKPKGNIKSQGFRKFASNTKTIDRGPWYD